MGIYILDWTAFNGWWNREVRPMEDIRWKKQRKTENDVCERFTKWGNKIITQHQPYWNTKKRGLECHDHSVPRKIPKENNEVVKWKPEEL